MKQFKSAVYKSLLFAGAILVSSACMGQETRTYQERFNVNPDVVVEVNTSHADVEFETWNKNEVVVEATIELEGASAEEAAAYFGKGGIEILGNSSKVEVRTQAERWEFHFSEDMDFNFEDFDVVVPEIPDVAPLVEEIMEQIPEIASMPPMPPMPPMPKKGFDYEAYKKDGEKYMKEWQKEFEKEFDEEYQKEFEAWGREMEERAREMEARMEENEALREEMREVRERQREEMREVREQQREEMTRQREEMREQMEEAREEARKSRVFYMRGEGGSRNFTIKKTIKVKMPKGARVKLNVRHGEVKLADNALNTKATLSYARLLATNIDGKSTNIQARYSPVAVKRWNYGRLQADYSEGIQLDVVGELDLDANSSIVRIDRLLRQATINSRMGSLQIGSVAEDFSDVAVLVEYGELSCNLPRSAYGIQITNDNSEVNYPDYISWSTAPNTSAIRKGYNQQKDSGRSIVINAAYSDISLQK
jgi:hypothetical protein